MGPLFKKQLKEPLKIMGYVCDQKAQNGRIRIKLTHWFVNSEASILDKSQRIMLAWNVALEENDEKRITVLLDYVADATKGLNVRGKIIIYTDENLILEGCPIYYSNPVYRVFYSPIFDKSDTATMNLPELFVPVPQRFMASHRKYIDALFKWMSGMRQGKPLPADELWQHSDMLLSLVKFSALSIEKLLCTKAVSKSKRIELTEELISIVKQTELKPSDLTKAFNSIMQGASIDGEINGVPPSAGEIAWARLLSLDPNDAFRDKFSSWTPGPLGCLSDLAIALDHFSNVRKLPYNSAVSLSAWPDLPRYDSPLNFTRPKCLDLNLKDKAESEIYYLEEESASKNAA